MTRIAVVLPRRDVPSETFIHAEIQALEALGWEVQVIETSRLRIAREVLTRPIRPIRLLRAFCAALKMGPSSLPPRMAGRTVPSILRLWVLLYALADVRLIVIHWPSAATIGVAAARVANLPCVWNIHSYEVGQWPDMCVWAATGGVHLRFCNRGTLARFEALAERESVGSSMSLIPHGVDLELFRPSEVPKLRERPELRLVSIGRLTGSKRVDLQLELMQSAIARGENVSLRVIGDGSIRSDLETTAMSLTLNRSVCFVGWLPRHSIAKEISDAHALLFTGDDQGDDGLPNVVLEALAAGRPVLMTELSGVDVVQHRMNGYVMPRNPRPGSIHVALGWLRRALRSSEDEVIKACRAAVLDEHDARLCAQRLSSALKQWADAG